MSAPYLPRRPRLVLQPGQRFGHLVFVRDDEYGVERTYMSQLMFKERRRQQLRGPT